MNCHAVSAFIIALSMLAGPAPLAQEAIPDTARPMTAYELLTIYGGKSWKWGDGGAAFMNEDGRQLVAWYGDAENFGYSRGRWTLTDTGRFCLVANWVTDEGTYPKRECFEHRVDDGTIYQRKLPDGAWFVFKHKVTEPEDEYNNIINEDLASSIVGDRPNGAPGQDTAPPDGRPIKPADGLVLGVYDPYGDFSSDTDVGIEHLFLPWEDVDLSTLPAGDEYARSRGRSILVTVEPWTWSENERITPNELLTGIMGGEYDSIITTICKAMGEFSMPTTIRWAQEMEDTIGRFTWAGWEPADYIGAYRKFVTDCRVLAPNARFMWSPKGLDNLEDYYPGDDVVDDIGLSVFGLQAYDNGEFGRDRTFAEVLKPGYDLVLQFQKPIYVAELGYVGNAAYVADWAQNSLKPDPDFPELVGSVYFNDKEVWPWLDEYGLPDWRVTHNTLD